MYLNKEKFLKTELGLNLIACVISWDKALDTISRYRCCPTLTNEYRRAKETANWCQAQWEVYQIMLKQFFKADYYFIRTDDLCCIADAQCSALSSATEFLYKVERNGENK